MRSSCNISLALHCFWLSLSCVLVLQLRADLVSWMAAPLGSVGMLDSYSWRGSAASSTCESELSLLLHASIILLAVFPSYACSDKACRVQDIHR